MLINHRPNEVPEVADSVPPDMKHPLGKSKKNKADNKSDARQKRKMKRDRCHKVGHHNKSCTTNID